MELTVTEAVVLGLLADDERSGYDLLKRIEGSVGYMWAPARSQLYAVLPRLVRGGLARRRVVRQSDRPDKQLYRATAAGREAFRRWLDEAEARTEDELLLKVFFGRHASPEALRDQLERYRSDQRARLAEYAAIEREIAADPASRHGYLTLRYGIALQRTRLRWLGEALRELG